MPAGRERSHDSNQVAIKPERFSCMVTVEVIANPGGTTTSLTQGRGVHLVLRRSPTEPVQHARDRMQAPESNPSDRQKPKVSVTLSTWERQ